MGASRELAELAGAYNSGSPFGFKNRIINGGMVIDQRNNGASVANLASNNASYFLDRWQCWLANSSTANASIQRSTVAPAGFTNSLLWTVTAAQASLAASFYSMLWQPIEGFNVADLGWGAANAQPVTLSFWVRSSATGTFGGSILNNAQNRSYPFSYTINSANTWEQKTVTISGDTSGTWLTDNSRGLIFCLAIGMPSAATGTAGSWSGSTFYSATGQTNLYANNGATWYVTGVQLEKGSTATSFDFRSYGQELALCQRYCQAIGGSKIYQHLGFGSAYNTSSVLFDVPLLVEMRTTPSVTTSGNWNVSDNVTSTAITSFALASGGDESSSKMVAGTAIVSGTPLTQYRFYVVAAANSLSSKYIISSEL